MEQWRNNLIEETNGMLTVLRETRRIAVLGIKPESDGEKAAYYVPAYMQRAGYEIIPVPVYYPEVTEILGREVIRDLRSVPPPVDLVNVFRRPKDIDQHVDDMIALGPKAVWFQLGIRNDGAARRLAEAGIKVVQDRCIMVEHGRL
ncbi:MAG: CoA-binding protein [Thermoanaerobaculia bacterium]